ncbi:MAG: hemerythrin domain-containing protein [Bryobacterales bacterium]|nr:hemerythrin domain-containing protein [Bryobacterales bacterium]MBV9399430.1 hemerythrin domain-containing protein [Bryobacterales bacterium]
MISTLNEAQAVSHTLECWHAVPIPRLIAYLSETHIRWIEQEMPSIENLAYRLEPSRTAPAVRFLQRLIRRIQNEMAEHLRKEEAILFPAILKLEQGGSAPMPFGSISNPIAMMEQDHDIERMLWEELRTLTNGYQITAEAGETLKTLYEELAALAHDVSEHAALENRILFPRARRMERLVNPR